MMVGPKLAPKEVEWKIHLIDRYFRLWAKGVVTGRELVDKLLSLLSYEDDFERVAEVTTKLMSQDSVDVSAWLEWIEPIHNDPQRIVIFGLRHKNDRPTHEDQQFRANYRQVAEIVRSVIKEHRPDSGSEEIKNV